MRHAQQGVEMGLGSKEGAMGVLKHANNHTEDVDGSTTAVVAVMHPPKTCEVGTLSIGWKFSFAAQRCRVVSWKKHASVQASDSAHFCSSDCQRGRQWLPSDP